MKKMLMICMAGLLVLLFPNAFCEKITDEETDLMLSKNEGE